MLTRPPARVSALPTAIVAMPDVSSRQRVSKFLSGLRWNVAEASGGAEALQFMESAPCEALLLDSWLPDLDVQEFLKECQLRHPEVDLVMLDQEGPIQSRRTPRRQELLMALRHALEGDSVSTANTPTPVRESSAPLPQQAAPARVFASGKTREPLPEIVGSSAPMVELTRLIHLVAPRRTTVLIEGPTGTGKELVAQALHRLSPRANKPMMVLNCAAIPESLLEAELFGHTRGAFTGAVNARVGRVEAANGGTLFLDEIGEMPLMLQSKLLRFLECGELQRVGDNDSIRVDVRLIAATHQPLSRRSAEGTFRADLYHRLAVFPIATPPLASRAEDIPPLAAHFLKRHGADGPVKSLSAEAMQMLLAYTWPGNVRELEHVIERAYILAEERPVIQPEDLALAAS